MRIGFSPGMPRYATNILTRSLLVMGLEGLRRPLIRHRLRFWGEAADKT